MFLFTGDSLEYAHVGFVIDYQNIHLTAHNLFTHNEPKQGLPPQEKGIDVLTALNFVEMAQSGDFDLVILMTHDTDLQPALKMASRAKGVRIESAGWSGLNKLRTKEFNLFHTFITLEDFQNSIDRKDYSKKG